MTISTQSRTRLLKEVASEARYVSLHIGDPLGTGAREVMGDYYHRQAIAWDDRFRSRNEIRFVLPDVTVTHVGYWDRETGGTFQFGGPLGRESRMDEGDSGTFSAGALSLGLTD